MKLNVVAFAALSALALAACKPADTASPTTATPAAPASAPAPAPETIAPAASGDTVAAGTGVPECDKYLEKVYACISDKVPEAQRDMMKKGIEQSKLSWSTVTDKGALAAQCSTAMEQAKASFGAIGCSF